eukprot:2369516-Rhodomonas_salina.2
MTGKVFYDGTGLMFTLVTSSDDFSGENRYKVRFVPGAVSRLQQLAFPAGQPITLYTTPTKKKIAAVVCVKRIKFAPHGRTAEITVSTIMHGGASGVNIRAQPTHAQGSGFA